MLINIIKEIFAKIKDGDGNIITSTDLGSGKRGLDVNVEITPSTSTKISDGAEVSQLLAVDVNGAITTKSNIPREVDSSGIIDANGEIFEINFDGYQSCAFQLTGTWVGVITFEVSYDDSATWHHSSLHKPTGVLSQLQIGVPEIVDDITANGIYKPNTMGGVCTYRLRATSWTSGSASIWASLTESPDSFNFTQASIVQNIILSVNNSSFANLAEGQQFIGQPDSTLGVFSIHIAFICDQRCKIQIQQSLDGTNWDVEDIIKVEFNKSEGRSFQAVASYYRIIVTNQGGQATTFMRLQSFLVPTGETLPRALTDEGSLKVAIVEDNPARLEGELIKYSTQDIEVRQLLEDILEQMVLMNMHMELMTDEHIQDFDIHGAD